MFRYITVGLFAVFLWTLPVVGQSQIRHYTVTIEGAGTGTYTQTITPTADGLFEVKAASAVHFKKFVVRVDYDFAGSELWKGAFCLSSEASKTEQGLTSQFRKEGYVDWTTSFWTLPARNWNRLRVLDLDTGTYQECVLKKIGEEQAGTHYKLSGGIETDLWFDASGRLTRRVMIRKGRTATVALTSVTNSK